MDRRVTARHLAFTAGRGADMAETFKRGDPVTVMPPYGDDPLIFNYQHYGRIAEVCGRPGQVVYYIVLDATWPTGERFGPFPVDRLRNGWRDERGQWRAAPGG